MARLFRFPNDSVGFDAVNNTACLSKHKRMVIYLLDGAGAEVSSTNPDVATVSLSSKEDDKAKKDKRLSDADRKASVRQVVMASAGMTGSTRLVVRRDGVEIVPPLNVYVVDDIYARRVSDSAGVEPDMKRELEQLSVRQIIARIARDQMTSGIRNHPEALSAFHHPKDYEPLWCGTFIAWCWNMAAQIKPDKVPKDLFRANGEALRSPQKAIDWCVKNPDKFALLRYDGYNPMTMKEKVAFRDLGDGGIWPQIGDIALWRTKTGWQGNLTTGKADGFQHVSCVKSFDDIFFRDINGNAYDAGAASIFAEVTHDTLKKTSHTNKYLAFFMCVTVTLD